MKLNIGCGRTYIEGWTNIDLVVSPRALKPPDLLCDIRRIKLPDACAEIAQAIHVFEHFYRYECDAVIDEWRRLLKRGGQLILEMPDLHKCCRNVLNGVVNHRNGNADQLGMWGLYGEVTSEDTILMAHHWLWTFKSIQPFLATHGFEDIREEETCFHLSGKGVRDFRVVATKA